MLLQEKLRTFRDVEELVNQAVTRLESLEKFGVPGNYDLAARHHLVEALTKITLGAYVTSTVPGLAQEEEHQEHR